MDIQAFLDAVSDAARNTRSDYHLTLGDLSERLRALPPEALIEFDDGSPVGNEDSYRGYYADLAFATGAEPATAAEMLKRCERAATSSYEGYKGGDFTYGTDTPLWRGEYGCCGPAIIDAVERDGKLILVTRNAA